jgi:hypothetical protein
LGFERGVFRALARDPVLVIEALRAGWGVRRSGGVLPSKSYLQWRSVTAYGDAMTTVGADDMVKYLRWRREMRRIRRG